MMKLSLKNPATLWGPINKLGLVLHWIKLALHRKKLLYETFHILNITLN